MGELAQAMLFQYFTEDLELKSIFSPELEIFFFFFW